MTLVKATAARYGPDTFHHAVANTDDLIPSIDYAILVAGDQGVGIAHLERYRFLAIQSHVVVV